jgi:hypothetical protein
MESVAHDWFKDLPKTVPADVDTMLAVAQRQRDIIEATKEEFFCPNGGHQSRYLVPKANRRRTYSVEGLVCTWLLVTPKKASIVLTKGQKAGLPVTQEGIDAAIQHSQKVVEERKHRGEKKREIKRLEKLRTKRERIQRFIGLCHATCIQCSQAFSYTGKGNPRSVCDRCQLENNRRVAREYARKHQNAKRANRTPEKAAKDRARRNARDRQKQKENIQYHLEKSLHSNLACIVKRLSNNQSSRKGYRTMAAVGCTPDFFKEWIESFFDSMPPHRDTGELMSWDNRPMWHIDHIYPKNICDYKRFEIVQIVWNYRNLRPLWGYANSSKGAKITTEGVDTILEIAKQLCA